MPDDKIAPLIEINGKISRLKKTNIKDSNGESNRGSFLFKGTCGESVSLSCDPILFKGLDSGTELTLKIVRTQLTIEEATKLDKPKKEKKKKDTVSVMGVQKE